MTTINQKLSEFLVAYAAHLNQEPQEPERSEFVKTFSALLRKVFRAHEREEAKRLRRLNSTRPTCACTIDGVDYASVNEACVTLGVGYSMAMNRIKSHYWPTWTSTEVRKVIVAREKKTKPRACTIEGVTYASITEAARELNISTGSVFFKLHSVNHPNWRVSE